MSEPQPSWGHLWFAYMGFGPPMVRQKLLQSLSLLPQSDRAIEPHKERGILINNPARWQDVIDAIKASRE